MASLRTCVLSLTLILCSVASAPAQPRRPMPPKIEPGTIVDVDDWGGIKQGEFIEVTRQGWIKVRMEDGEEKDFWAKDVRVSKTKKLKSKTARPAAGGSGLTGPRTWSDASGKFKIDASFVGLSGDKVDLKKADGSTVSVPLAKLSTADQDIARALASSAGSAPAGGDENPFEVSSDSTAAARPAPAAAPAAEPASSPSDIRRGDLTSAKTIDLNAGAYRAPAISAAPPAKFSSKGISLPVVRADIRKDHQAFQRMMTESPGDYLFVDRHRNQIWAPIEAIATRENEPVRVERLDLSSGKPASTLMFPPMKKILAVDASGKLVVALSTPEFGKSATRLDLFRVTGTKVDRVLHFEPYGDSDAWRESEVLAAEVVGTSHLLTTSRKGVVVLWKLPDMAPVYQVDSGDSFAIPALSADGKALAVASASGVFLLDALTGDVLGQMEQKLGGRSNGQLTFDATGGKLAYAGSAGVFVFDVATGRLLNQAKSRVSLDGVVPMGFASDRYLFAGGSLIDLNLGIVLCKYQEGHGEPQAFHGGRLWCLLTNRDATNIQRGLTHFEVPQPEALAKAEGVTRESLLVVKPGEKVGIQLNLSFSGEENQKIKDALIKTIQANGWVHSDESPVAVLMCEVTSQSKEEVFESFRGTRQNVTLTDYTGKVQLKKGDKVAWETGTSWHAPRSVLAKEGEAAAEVAKHKPNWEYFLGVKPPKDAIQYPEAGALCTATITTSGVQTQ